MDKEFPDKAPGWVGVGRAAVALAILAPVYLAALAVAWWAMSAKPGA